MVDKLFHGKTDKGIHLHTGSPRDSEVKPHFILEGDLDFLYKGLYNSLTKRPSTLDHPVWHKEF